MYFIHLCGLVIKLYINDSIKIFASSISNFFGKSFTFKILQNEWIEVVETVLTLT